MKAKLLIVSIALALLGVDVPAALALETCPPCCTQPADAPGTGAPCQRPCQSLVALACCDAAPLAPAPEARRSSDGPIHLPVPLALRASVPTLRDAPLRPASAELARWSSPLRLSVVLRI